MVWSARLSCRSPPRLSRWRRVWPLLAGTGATPASRAKQARPGGDIGVHGSIQLAQSLLEADLVDELQLVVGPAFGLPGRRLFAGTEDIRRLELLSAVPTPNGSVLLVYRLP
jgi:dihydrofolate reductase